MPTPPEIRESLPTRMEALGVSQGDLCRLIEWSGPQLSGFLSGKRNGMGFEEITRLNNIVTDLERLAKLLDPLPIDFRRTDSIRALIEQYRREGKI